MAKQCFKYMDVDVFAFLRKQMERNTEHFQTDFEIDMNMFNRFVASQSKEDKNLLWLSRPMGTHLQREREVFIRGTYDHNTWKFYAEQTKDPIVAFAVELTGKKNGVVRGNLYELDYPAHAAFVARRSVPAMDVEKTFEDGFVDRVSIKKGTHSYHMALVDEHGPIVKSRTISEDEERLNEVLAEQKQARSQMKDVAERDKRNLSVDEQISLANSKKGMKKERQKKDLDLAR